MRQARGQIKFYLYGYTVKAAERLSLGRSSFSCEATGQETFIVSFAACMDGLSNMLFLAA